MYWAVTSMFKAFYYTLTKLRQTRNIPAIKTENGGIDKHII